MRIVERSRATAPYLEAVEALLRHLPDDERQEVLDDLEEHLQEVAADTDGVLEPRLGSPDEYARTLVASLGLPVTPGLGRRRRLWATATSSTRRLRDLSATRAVVAAWPELRPGWWVVRAVALVAWLSLATTRSSSLTPWPAVAGSRLLGLVVLIGAVVASVRVGRVAPPRRRLDLALSVAGVLALLFVLTRPGEASRVEFVTMGGSGVLQDAEGQPISNIYAYDRDGRLLDQVLLYDQAGRPITNASSWDDQGDQYQRRLPLDTNGAVVDNVFPYDRSRLAWQPDGTLRAVAALPPAVVVPRLSQNTVVVDDSGTESPPGLATTAPPVASTVAADAPGSTVSPPTTSAGAASPAATALLPTTAPPPTIAPATAPDTAPTTAPTG